VAQIWNLYLNNQTLCVKVLPCLVSHKIKSQGNAEHDKLNITPSILMPKLIYQSSSHQCEDSLELKTWHSFLSHCQVQNQPLACSDPYSNSVFIQCTCILYLRLFMKKYIFQQLLAQSQTMKGT
jgi:hypothetical protein